MGKGRKSYHPSMAKSVGRWNKKHPRRFNILKKLQYYRKKVKYWEEQLRILNNGGRKIDNKKFDI